jgi:ribonuclease D
LSFKGLVEHIFRKTLNKNQQTSNWKERPFKIKQIEYAALDAFVLIRIYLYFLKYNNKKTVDDLVKRIDLTFEPLCLRANVHKREFNKSFQTSILID